MKQLPISWIVALLAVMAKCAGGQETENNEGALVSRSGTGSGRNTLHSTPGYYCSINLVAMVNTVCAFEGGVYSPGRKRTSDLYDARDWFTKRRRRGIVEECCRRTCGYSTLRRYCTFPGTSNRQLNAVQATPIYEEATSPEVTQRPTTTATTATPAASRYGVINQLTTSAHGLPTFFNDDMFLYPIYYRVNRSPEKDGHNGHYKDQAID